MKVCHYSEVEATREVPGVALRTVISAREGAPRFSMRVFELEPYASTPFHSHWWEHEVFILSGSGAVESEEGPIELREGDVIFVSPQEKHRFYNKGQEPLRFICVIPLAEEHRPAT